MPDQNEACPWEVPSDGVGGEGGRARKISIASGEVLTLNPDILGLSENHVPTSENSSNSVLVRPLSLHYLPQSQDQLSADLGQCSRELSTDLRQGGSDQLSADLGQVEIDLSQDKRAPTQGSGGEGTSSELSESPNKTQFRKKSSSALSGDEEIIVKKPSKSSPSSDNVQYNRTSVSATGLNSSCSPLYGVCQPLGMDSVAPSTSVTSQFSPGKCSKQEIDDLTSSPSTGERTNRVSREQGGDEGRSQGDPGENGCWITTQDVCPWEDDSLTPTWL